MKTAYSIYETKAHFSRLLKDVKNGTELIVTERGEPVAKIVPYREAKNLEERINQWVASGRIRPGKPGAIKPLAKRPGALKRFLEDR